MAHNRKDLVGLFNEIAELLESKRETVLAYLNTVETYKTAQIEIEKTVRALRTYSDELAPLEGRTPLGRVAVFLPFNTPLYSLVLYTFGALLAGNTVLVRPSSLTTNIVHRIWELIASRIREMPMRLVRTSGPAYVDCVLRADPVDAIIFTGNWDSVERLLPRVSQEIKLIYCGGGLSPFAVLEDADLEAAAESAIYSKTFNSGQDCLATERFYVASPVFRKFAALLVGKINCLRVGALGDPATDVGPLIRREFATNVARLIAQSHKMARVLHGAPISGSLVPPTVVEVPNSAPIVQAEKFSAVFPLVSFGDRDELLEYVNHPHYCLGASVYGKDLAGISGRLLAPHVAYNQNLLSLEEADAHTPFGGYKRSGFVAHHGTRRGGPILFSVETSFLPVS